MNTPGQANSSIDETIGDGSSEEEPSMEEILSSIRRIISDDDEEEADADMSAETTAEPEPSPEPAPEPAAEVQQVKNHRPYLQLWILKTTKLILRSLLIRHQNLIQSL